MMAASTGGTLRMIGAMVPDEDAASWVQTLKDIRTLPERRDRRRWL